MTQKKGLPNWISLFLKALLIMIFPLNNFGSNLLQLVILPTTGFLFTPVYGYPEFLIGFSLTLTSLGVVVRNLVLGLVIAFPGMFFNHKLSQAPVNKSYWKRGLGAAVGIYFLTIAIVSVLFANMYIPFGYYFDESLWMLYQNLMLYPTLVFGVFIILPLVQRQAVTIASPAFLHYHSMNDIESDPNLSVSREKFLSGLLWFFLCFAPFTIAYTSYFMWGGIPFQSLMLSYSFEGYSPLFGPIYQILIVTNNFGLFPFLALMNVFHFIFVRDIYRYLRKAITRQRLIGIAIFSSIGPFFISFGLIVFIPIYLIASLLPIPILQSVGFLIVRYHRPVADQVDRVWGDDTHSSWWEPEQERAKKEPIITTPEKPQRHRDSDIITVPVHYLVLSKLRSMSHRKK
ncbi:hypothetical protein E4H12_08535 [Candidatus Thorarchaeota archaeon]|nr:MAG: hypothetical protein E4H12_08535 [Candidatus Thorarchaeota archaeon]